MSDWKTIQIRRTQVVCYTSTGEYRSNIHQLDRAFSRIREENLTREDLINLLLRDYVGDDLGYTDGSKTDFELIMCLVDCGWCWTESDEVKNRIQE